MLKTLDNIKIRVNTNQGLDIIEIFTKIAESKEPIPVDWLKTLDNYFIVILDNLLSICLSEDDVNKNLDVALKNGLITKEYYLKKQIEDLYKQGLIKEECYNWALKV